MLELKADPDCQDSMGLTPLTHAKACQVLELVLMVRICTLFVRDFSSYSSANRSFSRCTTDVQAKDAFAVLSLASKIKQDISVQGSVELHQF